MEEWDAELQRRLDEIDASTVRLIDREEFSRRMHERLSARNAYQPYR
ncbi:MAG: addiction module protein [Steroidobacteraceae bacterium]